MKKIIFPLYILLFIQYSTYYFIAEKSLIKAIGRHYETYVFDYMDNEYDNIVFISKLPISPSVIQTHFLKFKNRTVRTCIIYDDCDFSRVGDFYNYIIDAKMWHPFAQHKVVETEFADSFGADWRSEYIWVLFHWVLIEKENIGVS